MPYNLREMSGICYKEKDNAEMLRYAYMYTSMYMYAIHDSLNAYARKLDGMWAAPENADR